MQFLVQCNDLLQERIALTVRACRILQTERAQFQMQFTHTVYDVQVLCIEHLDLVR